MVPSGETKDFCSKHNLPLPEGTLILGKGLFYLVVKSDVGTAESRGSFSMEGEKVSFVVELGNGAGLPRAMKLSEDSLKSDDGLFVREKKGGPKPTPAPVTPPVTPTAAAPVVISMPGTWTLRKVSGEDKVTRFFFNKNGEFWFKSDSSSSRGTYEATEEGIKLVWKEVDGSPVTFDMHKLLPWTEPGTTFKVDTYFYKKTEK